MRSNWKNKTGQFYAAAAVIVADWSAVSLTENTEVQALDLKSVLPNEFEGNLRAVELTPTALAAVVLSGFLPEHFVANFVLKPVCSVKVLESDCFPSMTHYLILLNTNPINTNN